MNWTLDLKQVEKEGFVMWNDHEIMPEHSVKLDRMKLVIGFLSVLTRGMSKRGPLKKGAMCQKGGHLPFFN